MSHRHALLAIAAAVFGGTALGGAWIGAGWSWDALNGVGFATTALLAFLCIETGAARSRPASQAAFYSRLHRNLGVMALTGVGVHAIGLALADRVTLEYWKPVAPLYMLAGTGACSLRPPFRRLGAHCSRTGRRFAVRIAMARWPSSVSPRGTCSVVASTSIRV
jgi:hypothetical protein